MSEILGSQTSLWRQAVKHGPHQGCMYCTKEMLQPGLSAAMLLSDLEDSMLVGWLAALLASTH